MSQLLGTDNLRNTDSPANVFAPGQSGRRCPSSAFKLAARSRDVELPEDTDIVINRYGTVLQYRVCPESAARWSPTTTPYSVLMAGKHLKTKVERLLRPSRNQIADLGYILSVTRTCSIIHHIGKLAVELPYTMSLGFAFGRALISHDH